MFNIPDPFKGQDLATVDATTLKNLDTMRKAAESAETEQFNPAIAKATGADGKLLSLLSDVLY